MKYLKKFNESSSHEREQASDEELAYMRDILQPMRDMHFDVDVYTGWHKGVAAIVMIEQGDRKSWWGDQSMSKEKRELEQEDFSSTIDHLKNYMDDCGYNVEERYVMSPTSVTYTFTRK